MFKMEEKTANVTIDLAEKIESFCKSISHHNPDRIQEFAQELVKQYSIPEIIYNPIYNGEKHGFDFCWGCQKYTQQSLVRENWKCERCGKSCN